MRTYTLSTFIFILATLFASQSFAIGALPYCDSDTACPDGFTCEMTVCPAIACAPGQPDCDTECPDEGICNPTPQPECTVDSDCGPGMVCDQNVTELMPPCVQSGDCPEPATYAKCSPSPCEADADCGDANLVCLSVEKPCPISVPETAVDCAPETDCEPAEPKQPTEPCVPETEQFCAPKWAAPCEIDNDCGDGFKCEDVIACQCSGSAGSPGMPTEPGKMPPPIPETDSGSSSDNDGGTDLPKKTDEDGQKEECDCEPTGEKHCQVQEIDCESVEDCPSDWSCEIIGGEATICVSTPDGEAECDEATTKEWKQCKPPHTDSWEDALNGGPEPLGQVNLEDDKGSGENSPSNAPSANSASNSGGCQTTGNSSTTGIATLLMMMAFVAIRRRLYN